MACEEARTLLDSLMGGDRNAPLPRGAAIPPSRRNKRKHENGGESGGQGQLLLLPGKRNKSCYDKDICPLYTAWGVDVYELFTNTKSDLNQVNPYVVDDAAHAEYQTLPDSEKQRLGFDYFLFQKLQELVRQGDRIIARNKDKLAQELLKHAQKTGTYRRGSASAGNTAAAAAAAIMEPSIDEAGIELLARAMIQVQDLELELQQQLDKFKEVHGKEEEQKQKLEALLLSLQNDKQQQQRPATDDANTSSTEDANVTNNAAAAAANDAASTADHPPSTTVTINEGGDNNSTVEIKIEEDAGTHVNVKVEEEDEDEETTPAAAAAAATAAAAAPISATDASGVKQEEDEAPENIVVKQEEEEKVSEQPSSAAAKEAQQANPDGNDDDNNNMAESLNDLQMQLGQLTLERQGRIFEIANTVGRLASLQESVVVQQRNLQNSYNKDNNAMNANINLDPSTSISISQDKTVCEVSGNFMSARDADERIAAHYAGKQYVGWKLVRDKFADMIKKYGRHGPPPPTATRGGGGERDRDAPMMTMHRGGGSAGGYSGGGAGGGGRSYGGGGGGYDRRGSGGGGGYGRYDGGGGGRGGGYNDRGPPDRGGGGGGYNRGGPPPPRSGGHWRR